MQWPRLADFRTLLWLVTTQSTFLPFFMCSRFSEFHRNRVATFCGKIQPIARNICCHTFGICGWLISLSTTTPLTNIVSSSLPPSLPCILISSKSTSFLSKSATDNTASTAISANCLWHRLTLIYIKSSKLLISCKVNMLHTVEPLSLKLWRETKNRLFELARIQVLEVN